MSGEGLEIPVSTPGAPTAIDLLTRIADAVDKTGAKAGEAAPKVSTLADKLAAIGTAARHFNELRTAADNAVTTIGAFAARVAALADEQRQLDTMSQRLGLDFDRAAASAGRFVDSTTAMTVASQFAARDVRLTQGELNDLLRVAGATADTLGTDVRTAALRLGDALAKGEQEGLGPFGEGLVRASGGAHTLNERLAALHTRAGEVATATDNAASRLARFRDEIQAAERTAATAFTNELARLAELGTSLDARTDDARDFKREIEAAGQTAARMVTQVVLGVGIIGGGIVTALGGLRDAVSLAEAATHGLAAFNRERDRLQHDGASAEAWNFTQGLVRRLEALDEDGNDRSSAPPAAPAAGPTAAATRADQRARTRRQSGGGNERGVDLVFTDEQAANVERGGSGSREEVAYEQLQGRAPADAAADAAARAARQQAQQAEQQRRDAERHSQQEYLRTKRDNESLLELHRSYTGQLSELYNTQANAAQGAAQLSSKAIEGFGKAFATHALAVASGAETVGQALQGMLADTLGSIAQEAAVKGAFEIAQGVGALAGIVTAGLAPGHFAAGAAYLGVAALAGAGSVALAPSPATSSASAPTGSARAASVTPQREGREGPAQIVEHNYYAPVIGGRTASEGESGMQVNRLTNAERRRTNRQAA